MTALDVVLPVKNGLPYLEEAIESIRAQTFDDFALFVIDDGSSDETASLVASLADRDSRIKPIDCAGEGLIDALNQGLTLSSSPFIARMDADDISMPTRFEKQISYLRAHTDVDVVGCWTELIDKRGNLLDAIEKYPPSPTEIRRQLLSNKNPLAHPTVMMRSDRVKTLGGYRKPLKAAEDFDLWLRMAETGELANIAEPLLKYRLHPDQVSAKQRLAQSFASELAFICSEERRAARKDPVMFLSDTATWHKRDFHGGTPAVTDLCDRFTVMSDVLQSAPCQRDLLHSALAHIARFHISMSINHRLYADVSAMIAVQALRSGALIMAVRAFRVGSMQSMRRFLKMLLKNLLYPSTTI